MQSVSSKLFNANTKSALQKLDDQITKRQLEVSSGKKDLGLAKDSVEINQINYIKKSLSHLEMETESIETAINQLKPQEAALSEIGNSIIRLQELALQAKTASISNEQMKSIAEEADQIKLHIFDLANSKDHRGNALFGGTLGKDDAFVFNQNGDINYAGSHDEGIVEVSENKSAVTHLNGGKIFTNTAQNEGTAHLFDTIGKFVNLLTDGNKNLDATIENLDAAHQSLVENIAKVGVSINSLTTKLSTNKDLELDIVAKLSKLEDTDLAAAITDIKQLMLTKDATQQIYAKISQQSLFDYIR